MLRHVGKGAGQAAEFIATLQGELGRQIASGHLAHAVGQHQQRPHDLVAQQHRQQHGAKQREEQTQGERSYVHALQTFTRQRALLVLAVRLGHGQRVRDECVGQRPRDQQKTRLALQVEAGVGYRGQSADARVVDGGRCRLFQAFHPGGRARAARIAKLLRARSRSTELELRLAGRGQRLARAGKQHHVDRAELVAQALQRQRGGGVGYGGERGGGNPRLGRKVGTQGFQRDTAQVQPGVQRALDLDVEPAFDGARDKLVRHHVDEHTRGEARERENRGQLEQQAAAKALAAQAHQQAHNDPDNHQQQQARHHHVEREQPRVIALVQLTVVGGLRQQEQQHKANRRHRGKAYPYRPAQCAVVLAQVGRRVTRRLRGAHLAASMPICWFAVAEIDQSDWPNAPIWNGRGSWVKSSAKRNCTLCVASGSSRLASAIFQPENRRRAEIASGSASKF